MSFIVFLSVIVSLPVIAMLVLVTHGNIWRIRSQRIDAP